MKLLLKSPVPTDITLRKCLEQLVLEQQNKLESGVRDSLQRAPAGAAAGQSGAASPRQISLQFFHPLIFQKLGDIIADGYEGAFDHTRPDRAVPLDVAAYMKGLTDLTRCSEALLDSIQWLNMRPLFSLVEKEKLFKATAPKKVRLVCPSCHPIPFHSKNASPPPP